MMKRVARSDKGSVVHLLPKDIAPGDRLRLRKGFLGHVHPREWIFKRIESDGTILLIHESGGFGWSVKPENIDWEAYKNEKDKGLSSEIKEAI